MTSPKHSSHTHTAISRLLTAKQAAEVLQSSVRTVRRLVASGELQAIRIGRLVRIHPGELEAFLNNATESDKSNK